MAKRGAKVYRVNLNGDMKEMTPAQFNFLEKKQEYRSRNIKRTFYMFLDLVLLISFALSLYSIYLENYIQTILFLIVGSLLLLFFTLKRAFRRKVIRKN